MIVMWDSVFIVYCKDYYIKSNRAKGLGGGVDFLGFLGIFWKFLIQNVRKIFQETHRGPENRARSPCKKSEKFDALVRAISPVIILNIVCI